MMKYRLLIIFFRPWLLLTGLLSAMFAFAGQCPTPEQVRERKISQDYEWTVSEDTTLHTVLSAKRLAKVRIENYGEFVSCYYESEGLQFRLDGLPKTGECLLVKGDGQWLIMAEGGLECTEEDPAQCHFNLDCLNG